MLSANALRRLSEDYSLPIGEGDRWMMDSGAFSQISGEAGFYQSPAEYAIEIHRWCRFGTLVAAVTQDYMCEPHILHQLDTNAKEQQERTVKRYDEILGHLSRLGTDTHLMPVLQGWEPRHYKRHLEMYGDRLTEDMWVGVGSICKRNSSPADVEKVLSAITDRRPDLRLHGFGIKTTALRRNPVTKICGTSGECLCGAFDEDGQALDELKAQCNLLGEMDLYERIISLQEEVFEEYPWRYDGRPPHWFAEARKGQMALEGLPRSDDQNRVAQRMCVGCGKQSVQ